MYNSNRKKKNKQFFESSTFPRRTSSRSSHDMFQSWEFVYQRFEIKICTSYFCFVTHSSVDCPSLKRHTQKKTKTDISLQKTKTCFQIMDWKTLNFPSSQD